MVKLIEGDVPNHLRDGQRTLQTKSDIAHESHEQLHATEYERQDGEADAAAVLSGDRTAMQKIQLTYSQPETPHAGKRCSTARRKTGA